MLLGKKISKNKNIIFIRDTFLQVFRSGLGLILSSFLSNKFSVIYFSNYNYIISLLASFKGVLDPGVSYWILKTNQKKSNIKKSIISFFLPIQFFTTIIILLISYKLFFSDFSIYLVIIWGLFGYFLTFVTPVLINISLIQGKYLQNQLIIIFFHTLLLLSIFIFDQSLINLFFTIYTIIFFLYLIYFFIGYFTNFSNLLIQIKSILKYSKPLILYGIVTLFFSQIDRIFALNINSVLTQSKISIITIFIGLLSVTLIHISRLIIKEKGKKTKNLTWTLNVFRFFIFFLIIVLDINLNFIINFFYNESYILSSLEKNTFLIVLATYFGTFRILSNSYGKGLTKEISKVGIFSMLILTVIVLIIYLSNYYLSSQFVLIYISKILFLQLLQFFFLGYYYNRNIFVEEFKFSFLLISIIILI